ncbi:MAG: CocE/NonD family hydrolase [Verrucomicrobia bacterium]|nr:CocE/NonD family hydrolase [Verrucomicrobiota bacterium]
MTSSISSSRALLLCVFLAVSVLAENDQPPFIFEADVKVPMRDGVQLAANVFRPKGDGPWPVILIRTPYGKGDEKWPGAKDVAAKGYVTVVQDCRGRGKSEGIWEPFLHEGQDGFDTQEWVGKQSWCDGNVGTSSASYAGWTQWASAPNSSKYLKAMVPMVPFGNTYEDLAYSGGAVMLGLLMGWGEAVGGVALDSNKLQQAYNYLPLRTFGDQFEKKIPYLNEWVQHATYDAYWKQRGIDYRYAEITVPTLNVGGWYDIFSKATLDLTTGVRTKSRSPQARTNQFVIMGPWGHGVGVRKTGELDFGADAELKIFSRQFDWYEYWLKGRERKIHDWPPYYLFVMGENRWHSENEWPLKRTRFTPYYLRSSGHANSLKGDGSLNTTQPGTEPKDGFTYDGDNPVATVGGNNIVGATAGPCDQTKLEEREDVLVYSTAPLEQEVEVTGPVKLILWAASSARDTDFTGKLVDVHPDGKAYNLCEGILRARYRNGPDKPALLEPGQTQRFEIDLWVTSNLFKRGHRIRLEVSSSNYPRFDRNPNSGNPIGSDTEMLTAKQTILHDREHASHLLLPVIPRP